MKSYIVKELLHYCNVSPKRISSIEEAYIPYFDFTFVLKGEMRYSVDGKDYTLSANDAILIRPGSLRKRYATEPGAKYVSYNFTVFDDADIPQKTYLKNIISQDIKTLVSVFSASHISTIYSSREKVINLLNYILFEIKDILELESSNKHIIGIIKHIDEHISEPITLSKISSHMNLSKEYISYIFKKETGKTVTEYINERKLFIAKKMILETSYPLTYISERVGYENYSYFSRLFKNKFGVSPRALNAQKEERM